MINKIKETREKEIKAEELKKEMEEQSKVIKKNIIDTLKDVNDGSIRTQRDEKTGGILGVTGGKYIQKLVYIGGYPVMLTGKNEEELKQDEKDAKQFLVEHNRSLGLGIRDVAVAEDLIDAEIIPDEQIETEIGTLFILYNEKIIMDTEGNTVVDLKDIPDKLSKETIKKLLLERLCSHKESNLDDDDDESNNSDESTNILGLLRL